MLEMSRTIKKVAEKTTKLNDRFAVVEHFSRPAMIIVDRTTGKATTVSLYAYGAVREALDDLFGAA